MHQRGLVRSAIHDAIHDAHDACAIHAHDVCAIHGPHAQFSDALRSPHRYKTTADALASTYLAAGYDSIHIDDCWEGTRPPRDAAGKLYPNATRFPSGFGGLADYVHAKGVKFGVYSDEGTETCGGYPGSKGHEAIDAATFAAWGVDYLKLDGCYNDKSHYAEGYAAMGKALRAPSQSRPIEYSCSWPAYLGDDESAKPWDEMIAAGCNGWRNWADIQCSWESLSGIIEHWGEYSRVMQAVAAPGHWNDPDMLLIGAKDASGKACLSVAEERTQMAIWSLSAAPLIMGNDARDVRNASLQILLNRDAIAIDQDAKGEQGVRLVDGAHQVWARNLTGGAVAVGLYNHGGGAPPIPPPPCDTWTHTAGSYYDASGGAAGDLGTFDAKTAAEAQAECCANPKCAGFSFSVGGAGGKGSGYYKANAQGGLVKNAGYDGYTKPSQVPTPPAPADITIAFADVGLCGGATVEAPCAATVYDVWAGKDLGTFSGSYTAKGVLPHDTAFLRLRAA